LAPPAVSYTASTVTPSPFRYFLALRQRLRMRVHVLHVGELVPGSACRQCTTSSSIFAGDRQVVLDQQVVVAVDGAADRVLERQHAVRDALLGHRGKHVVERLAGSVSTWLPPYARAAASL
jgi:hypothetical protein